ncbi:MAG TPA: hypothetical protein PK453_26730, partial [Leptospiraceae bacterium]|nr:hypothetical protein [Leptospiraceae bacterium]
MISASLKSSLSLIPDFTDREKVFRILRRRIAEEGFFNVLKTDDFSLFHEKLRDFSLQRFSPGLPVAVMAQVNVAGKILRTVSDSGSQEAERILNDIILGNISASMGISEKGWKGRTSNLKTVIRFSENFGIIDGEKSFFTNGANSELLIILCFDSDRNCFAAAVEKETEGLKTENFSLDFAAEATHCSAVFTELKVPKERIFSLDYRKIGENLRLSELVSLGAVFAGFSEKLISSADIPIDPERLEIFLFARQKLWDKIIYISELKKENPDLPMKDY